MRSVAGELPRLISLSDYRRFIVCESVTCMMAVGIMAVRRMGAVLAASGGGTGRVGGGSALATGAAMSLAAKNTDIQSSSG